MTISPAPLALASTLLRPSRGKSHDPWLIGLVLFALALLAAELAVILLGTPDVDALSAIYNLT